MLSISAGILIPLRISNSNTKPRISSVVRLKISMGRRDSRLKSSINKGRTSRASLTGAMRLFTTVIAPSALRK